MISYISSKMNIKIAYKIPKNTLAKTKNPLGSRGKKKTKLYNYQVETSLKIKYNFFYIINQKSLHFDCKDPYIKSFFLFKKELPTYYITTFLSSNSCLLFLTTWQDRKSTRLNSSHGYISYAVF